MDKAYETYKSKRENKEAGAEEMLANEEEAIAAYEEALKYLKKVRSRKNTNYTNNCRENIEIHKGNKKNIEKQMKKKK